MNTFICNNKCKKRKKYFKNYTREGYKYSKKQEITHATAAKH